MRGAPHASDLWSFEQEVSKELKVTTGITGLSAVVLINQLPEQKSLSYSVADPWDGNTSTVDQGYAAGPQGPPRHTTGSNYLFKTVSLLGLKV